MSVGVVILDTVETGFDIFDTSNDTRGVPSLEFQQFAGNSRIAVLWHKPCICSTTKRAMFRISIVDSDRERRLVVEGTLVQPWVPELRRSWREASESTGTRALVIDLTNATMIDREGEAAIFDLMKEGAKFCCSDVLTKHVLKQLAHRCHTRLRNVLNRPGSGSRPCLDREER